MDAQTLVTTLRQSQVFASKKAINVVRQAFGDTFSQYGIANGDDAAAVPDDNGGWLLLAAEGILPELVEANPELAGRSAVLANVNDIYAMGGRPLAMVDVLGSADSDVLAAICKGMRDNALRFGVPIVGGHVQDTAQNSSVSLAIMGRAKNLVTSFDAQPGDALVLVTNMDGLWLRGPNYWNCTLPRHDGQLRENLDLIAQAAEAGLTKAGKDVSMAGIAGTLLMLCECSNVGADLEIDSVPLPQGCSRDTDMEPWLRAFFSYGFLLTTNEASLVELVQPFLSRGLHASRIGKIVSGSSVMLCDQDGSSALLHDWKAEPFIGF